MKTTKNKLPDGILRGMNQEASPDLDLIEHLKDERSLYYRMLIIIPVGIENAISMRDLANVLGIAPRDVREFVLNANRHGLVIGSTCAENGGGYFIPANIDELKSAYREKRGRALTTLSGVKQMRRILVNHGINPDGEESEQ